MGRRAYTKADQRVLEVVAERLRDARLSAKLTQVELAKTIGMSRAGVAMLESHRGSPSLPTLIAWAHATGMTVATLVGDL